MHETSLPTSCSRLLVYCGAKYPIVHQICCRAFDLDPKETGFKPGVGDAIHTINASPVIPGRLSL